jgi:hypothetical protein
MRLTSSVTLLKLVFLQVSQEVIQVTRSRHVDSIAGHLLFLSTKFKNFSPNAYMRGTTAYDSMKLFVEN